MSQNDVLIISGAIADYLRKKRYETIDTIIETGGAIEIATIAINSLFKIVDSKTPSGMKNEGNQP